MFSIEGNAKNICLIKGLKKIFSLHLSVYEQ